MNHGRKPTIQSINKLENNEFFRNLLTLTKICLY